MNYPHSLARRLCLAAFVLSTAPLLIACAPQVYEVSPHTTAADLRTITVVGRGEVTAKPDVARANLGVELTAPTLAEAMRTASARMAAVLGALKKAGIAEKDLRTSNFSISLDRMPEPLIPTAAVAPPPLGPAPKGAPGPVPAQTETPRLREMYRVSNTVTATVRNIEQVGPVLDAAVAAGANSVWGIDFSLDKTDALEAQAREKAVADARARAETLARLQGVSLGAVVSLSESVDGPGLPVPVASMAKDAYGGNTPVAPGEVGLSAQVKVVYVLKDGANQTR